MRRLWLGLAYLAITGTSWAQSASLLEQRRQAAMALLPDGILLVHASAIVPSPKLPTFSQSPYFYYFSGIANGVSLILALDGQKKQSWLFVPDQLVGVLGRLTAGRVTSSLQLQEQTHIQHILPWTELAAFIDERLRANRPPVLYTAETALRATNSFPPNVTTQGQPALFWHYAVAQRWPTAQVRPANEQINGLLLVKDTVEAEHLRRAGRASASALRVGMQALSAGKTQREIEAEIVLGCYKAGADAPAFWPWAMSGSNAAFPRPFDSLIDYHHLNKRLTAGELVRLDMGCEVDHYGADVGRTVPVSGRFDSGQREAWNLFVSAYQAGLAQIRAGVKVEQIRQAWRRAIAERQPALRTALGKAAAEVFLSPAGQRFWSLHTVGLEGVPEQAIADELRAGMVIAYEPIATVQGQGFYLEDTLLITAEGYENLSAGLPYTADEIERAMRRLRHSGSPN